jgi:hypothetical protein
MKNNLLWLALAWAGFYASHSALAHSRVKALVAQWAGANYRFYRLGFNVFSTIFFIALVQWLFSLPAWPLVPETITQKLIGALALSARLGGVAARLSFLQQSRVYRPRATSPKARHKPNSSRAGHHRPLCLRAPSALLRHHPHAARCAALLAPLAHARVRRRYVSLLTHWRTPRRAKTHLRIWRHLPQISKPSQNARAVCVLKLLWQVTEVFRELILRATLLRTVDYFDHRNKQPCPPLAEVAHSAGGGFNVCGLAD